MNEGALKIHIALGEMGRKLCHKNVQLPTELAE
jgi:hypothetical protein